MMIVDESASMVDGVTVLERKLRFIPPGSQRDVARHSSRRGMGSIPPPPTHCVDRGLSTATLPPFKHSGCSENKL